MMIFFLVLICWFKTWLLFVQC
uniref:Uncharacterized protein n=1 Tax=Anguilla anguilla TaxID=7936 RepID=A0A0E9XUK0_ANGAN